MPEGGNNRACSQPHIFRPAGQISQIDEGIGGDGKIHAVMLACPDRAHAARVGNLAQPDKLVIEFFLALFSGNALKMNKKRKLHLRLTSFFASVNKSGELRPCLDCPDKCRNGPSGSLPQSGAA